MQKYLDHLRNGGVLAYPTETVWGLGADVHQASAVEEIFKIKGRDSKAPLSILVRDAEMAKEVVDLSPALRKFVEIFWPGPMTFVLPAKNKNLAQLLGSISDIGLRCSSHPFVQKLMNDYPHPVVTTSANPSGKPPAMSLNDLTWLPNNVLQVTGEPDPSQKISSTVMRVLGNRCEILREGPVPLYLLKEAAEHLGFEFSKEQK